MKLSLLVFKCVKNVIYYDDTSFTYDSLKDQNFETDNRDYKTSLENIFSPLNEAIHRLSDRNKIATKSEPLPSADVDGIIEIPDYIPLKTIVNLFVIGEGSYRNIPFRTLGFNRVVILDKLAIKEKSKIYMEYREDIRHFDFTDIQGDSAEIELKNYGINETMCSYIMEFCKGRLMETIDPSMAAYHNNLAEQYMEGLDEQVSNFNQQQVVNKWGIY